MKHTFPRIYRLRKSWEYQRVWQMGCKLHTPHFILLWMDKPNGTARLGLTVSRKVGNAVVRNRVKRFIREFFRLNFHNFKRPVDLSIVAKKGASVLTAEQVSSELAGYFKNAKV